MTIRLARGKNDKPPILTCTRDNGSVTYQASSSFFACHDLWHYAVETTLGYADAFFGMVAWGRNLDDFGTRNGVKDTYTPHALWAEQIVGALQFAALSTPFLRDVEVVEQVRQNCAAHGLPAPPVTPEQIARIRVIADDLHMRWDRLAPGEALTLPFPAQGTP